MGQVPVHSIHHANFPISDPAATEEWYGKVFGMKKVDVSAVTPNTRTLLMEAPGGRFHLHFRPTNKPDVLPGKVHFALEVDDWDATLAHLDSVGISYNERATDPGRGGGARPSDNSKTASIKDPDGYIVELTYHEGRDW